MIMTQTPYRVSFAGGGTDLAAFYQHEYGAVFSVTISRHLYVTIHGRFQSDIRVAYSKTEVVPHVNELQHELVREALRFLDLNGPIEITTIGDVPAGTGMGSSSVLTVGLLNALHAFKSQVVGRELLAKEACVIEIDRVGKPIGKQDQYAAAYGGFNYFRFNPDGTVDVEPVPVAERVARQLEQHALLLYTEQQREADSILRHQGKGTAERMPMLREMRDLADAMRQALLEPNLLLFGTLLHQGWELKRSLGFGISNERIDRWYAAARQEGAWGGKLLGAGGGGFLFLLAPPENHAAIRAALQHPPELPFQIDRQGSRIVFVSDHHG